MFNRIAKKILNISNELDKQGFYKIADNLTQVSVRLSQSQLSSVNDDWSLPENGPYIPFKDWAKTPLALQLFRGLDLGPMAMSSYLNDLIGPAPARVPSPDASPAEKLEYRRQMNEYREKVEKYVRQQYIPYVTGVVQQGLNNMPTATLPRPYAPYDDKIPPENQQQSYNMSGHTYYPPK